MDNHLPFGYTHRQKRSHDMMEANDGPAWSFENLTPFTSLGVPREYSVPRSQEASHSAAHRDLSPQPNYHAVAAQRARTPDAGPAQTRHSASHEPAAQANDRPTSAGPADRAARRNDPRLEHPARDMEQIPRFQGDGFDMRRPVGWHSNVENHDLVQSNDSEDDELIMVNEDGEDIARYNEQLAERDGPEDVVDLTEDDVPFHNWPPQNNRPERNIARPRLRSGHTRLPRIEAARLPRGMAGIINLDNGEEAWHADDWREDDEPVILEPSSPDVQFVSARRLDPNDRLSLPLQRYLDGDDVQFVQARPLTDQERMARQRTLRNAELDRVLTVLQQRSDDRYSFAHLRGEIDRANAHIQQLADNMRQGGPQPPPRVRGPGHIRVGVAAGGAMFVAPNLNFGVVGFDLGFGGNQPEPPAPTYEAPPPAPEGFTRSPDEEDVLVCPHCDSELCKGDDDIKKQVWIAKQCGHMYCGECAANRSIKKSAKGKEKQVPPKTKPFKECVVEGCGKKVSSSKAMFQVFML